jgi:DNA-binding GntR family transcriptional regulator
MDKHDPQQGNTAQSEALQSVDKRTLDERVYDQLREAIMGGAFRPGDVVTLRGLAKAFGTSLMPVRNAVNRLTVENGLLALPNRSISLPRLTVPEFEEMTDIRVALESLAARHAARRISATQIDRIEVLNSAMGGASPGEYFRLNREFHFSIYAAAEQPVLFRLIQGAWLRVGPLLNSLESQTTVLSHVNHDWVVRALRRHDAEDAAVAIAADVRSAAHVLRELVEKSSSQEQASNRKGSRRRERTRAA